VTGKATEALGSITMALQIAGTMGTYWFEAELHRVKGELQLAWTRRTPPKRRLF